MLPMSFIPASNEPSAVLARAFGECREGLLTVIVDRAVAPEIKKSEV